MIKRYHEAPISMFEKVQKVTDGDYALVHLFEENDAYLNMFKKAVATGRDVILDNSIFELGTAFDSNKFAKWVKELKPTWYIVPDSWKNGKETIRMFNEFIEAHPDLPGKRIGVAQGWTLAEVAESYRALQNKCDMIAFNLDFSSVFYDTFLPEIPMEYKHKLVPYCVAMSIGRYMILKRLYSSGMIDPNKPHHLLGCGVPQEVQWYSKTWTWIRSIDTSNPVVAGMCHKRYDPKYGIDWKSDLKMCNMIDFLTSVEQERDVMSNILAMKEWCS